MTNKRVTLSVDSKIYDEYKKYCEEKGMILSKQFELFMREEIKKFKRGRWYGKQLIEQYRAK